MIKKLCWKRYTIALPIRITRNRAQDEAFYAKQLIDYLAQFSCANRDDINTLLLDKLSDALNPVQKDRKIANLLSKLRRQGRIVNKGSRTHPSWQLAESSQPKK